jgi:hypothetical protein
MIYKATPVKDNLLEKVYSESMTSLNEFYEIDWVYGLPKIITISDRKTINLLRQRKTEAWEVGWAEGKSVYVLDRENFEKESDHKYSDETYRALVKHELSHCFYHILSNQEHKPIWLNEGVAIYTSGQNKFKKKPTEFKKFLQFYDEGGGSVYFESGFAVESLVKKYGKAKLLELIKRLENIRSKEEFDVLFKTIYGFESTYENFNSLLT